MLTRTLPAAFPPALPGCSQASPGWGLAARRSWRSAALAERAARRERGSRAGVAATRPGALRELKGKTPGPAKLKESFLEEKGASRSPASSWGLRG